MKALFAVLAASFALTSASAQAVETVKLNNLYVQKSFGQYFSVISFLGVLDGNLTWPVVGGVLASFKDSDCDSMRRMVERFSNDEVTFRTSKCYDARKLALNTMVFGASNWGFNVDLIAKAPLRSGDNEIKLASPVFGGKSTTQAFEACSKVFAMMSKLSVGAYETERKAGDGFTHAVIFKGGCNVVGDRAVALTVSPVINVR
jgi:hypothetical protein